MNEEIEFSCPYCGEINTIEVFASEGNRQSFVNDCEVCCRPIQITATFDKEGDVFLDIKNDEGF